MRWSRIWRSLHKYLLLVIPIALIVLFLILSNKHICHVGFYIKHNITFYDIDKSKTECERNQYACVAMKTDFLPDYQVCTYDPDEDKPASEVLQDTQRWKPHLANQIAEVLQRDKELGFLDMGAGLGVFSLLATSLGRKVLAIEPLITNVQRIHRAAKLNKVEHLLTIITNPIFSARKEVNIGFVAGNMGGARIDFQHAFPKTQDKTSTSIYANDLVPVLPFKSAVMKVAIQGFEIAAFYYASELLEAVQIPVIFMEWGYINESSELNHLVDLLLNHNYKPYSSLSEERVDFKQLKYWIDDIVWIKSD